MDIRSLEPFWVLQNSFITSYPSLTEDITTSVVIIGAGITGALIAHTLIEAGYDVTLVDKRDVCHGSTAASTAMLQYEVDVPLYTLIDKVGITNAVTSYKQCDVAIDTLEAIVSEINSNCDFRKKESVLFTTEKKEVPSLRKEYEARCNHGFEVSWLDKNAIQGLGVHNGQAGIKSTAGAVINPYIFAQDLLLYAVKKGLKVFDKTEIKDRNQKGDNMVLTTRTGNVIKTSHVIHCTGYESVETLPKDTVTLISTYAIASEVFADLPSPFKNMILWDTADPYHYYRGTEDGRIIMGGGDTPFKNAKARDSLLAKKEKQLVKTFQKTFPAIPFIKDYSWAGTFGETKDGLPYMGKPDPNRNEHYILGFGGNGITFSVMGRDVIIPSIEGRPHPFLEYYKFDR
ncbi:FAD-dependent oxidoreductase [Altibacter sp.]|uniref:NAD(P)/FAD-dependent oxidoreductase n=1 Tax=Altibacter sp. TaxID=2024823 RepID=UPI000C8CB03E|nr:FAD-dependent oxidoreductase [Altibacter sp.]MAP56012.1 FAD-dependent oxidoreductase [Altibacter sp.]